MDGVEGCCGLVFGGCFAAGLDCLDGGVVSPPFAGRFAGDRSGAGEVVFASGAVGAWAPFSGFATAPGSRGPLAVGFAGFGSEAPVLVPVGAPCVAVVVPLDLGAAGDKLPIAGLVAAGVAAAPT